MKLRLAFALAVAPLLMLGPGCGGTTGTLALSIVTSPSDDPFVGAATVRISIGDTMHVVTSPVSGGHFSVSYTRPPTMTTGPVTVEALDATGAVIAHGTTPPLTLTAMNQTVSVWVGRPGKTQTSPSALPTARNEIAAVNVVGLGAELAGGSDATGMPIADNVIYDVYTQAIIQTSPMQKARAGAVAAPAGTLHNVVLGGLTTGGMVDASMELFDPSMGLGVWSPVPIMKFAGRRDAVATVLDSGNTLVTGGADAMGNPLADAAIITDSGSITLTPLATSMTAPRVGHAVAPAHFSDGDGAIVFGGLADGSMLPVAERLVNQSFSAYDAGFTNRVNATATKMASGDVLILGGKDATGALASGLVITPTLPMPTVNALPQALSVAREGHTASLTGSELVVCGGSDAMGMVQDSCDVLDGKDYSLKRSFKLAAPRRSQAAVVLDNGLVVLAGGLGSDGKPLSSIEIYTP